MIHHFSCHVGDESTTRCFWQVYKQFKEGQKRILVATDLVGRGIDIERVNIVINYDMPETDDRHGNGADSYLHRVRTAEMQVELLCSFIDAPTHS